MAEIFLSYRREDSAGQAGPIFEHLSARFGSGRVFRMGMVSTRVKTQNRAKLLVSQPPISKHRIWRLSGP